MAVPETHHFIKLMLLLGDVKTEFQHFYMDALRGSFHIQSSVVYFLLRFVPWWWLTFSSVCIKDFKVS